MLLGQGLSTFKGIERSDWLERTGQRPEDTLRKPAVKGYVEWFHRRVGLVEDEVGIRLQREGLVDAFIEMLLTLNQ